MIREVWEETGIKVSEENLDFFKTLYVSLDGDDFVFHMYSVNLDTLPEVNININEHSEYLWVTFEESLDKDMLDHETLKLFFY